ncbi:carbohydrate ABC transporter permease, partial [Hominenteromicrobium sp.]|uniref:carbohydrate ABC transporter permease n=1 Tax=Hominenteromicrobium sp. TaxID=3073581 RepID=UPI003AF147A0
KKKSSAVLRRVLLYIVLILIAVIMVVPFLWMLSTSLKTQYDAVKIPPVWIPDPPQWENYVKLFTEQPMFQFMLNSIKIVFFVVLGQLFFSSLAAYSFARISFKGRNVVFFFYIATLMVPGQVTMIPTYLMFAKAGLTDNHLALILPAFFSAFGVFLLRQFFMSLPRELEEAAEIDGCNPFMTYWRIMLPLVVPAMLTLGVFTLMNTWNDYMGPLIYLSSPEKYTMTLGIAYFKGVYTTQWNLVMAGSIVSVVPILIAYLCAQKYFIEGIAFSGVKG